MIVSNSFQGDINDTLKWVQHDAYADLVGDLFVQARERYQRAARLLGVETELLWKVSQIAEFDHRVLQEMHDRIAAYYRRRRDLFGQLSLFADAPPTTEMIRQAWETYFHQEVRGLMEAENAVVIAVLQAMAYQNTPSGYEAEDTLRVLLEQRYPFE